MGAKAAAPHGIALAGLLPGTFTSKKVKKGVYYNWYLMINNLNPEGGIISSS